MATLTNFSSLWMNLIMTQQKISKVLNKLRPNVIEGYHSKLEISNPHKLNDFIH